MASASQHGHGVRAGGGIGGGGVDAYSSSSSSSSTDLKLVQLKALHDQSFRLLSTALDQEEQLYRSKRSNSSTSSSSEPTISSILTLYQRGSSILKQALLASSPITKFPPNERTEASVLVEKMNKNLMLVEERIAVLMVAQHQQQEAADLTASSSTPPSSQDHSNDTSSSSIMGFFSSIANSAANSLPSLSSLSLPSFDSNSESPPTNTAHRTTTQNLPKTSTPLNNNHNNNESTSSPAAKNKKPLSTAATTTKPHQQHSYPLRSNNKQPPPSTQQQQPQTTPPQTTSNDDYLKAYLPELQRIDPSIRETIINEIVDRSPNVKWSDIVGMESVKQLLLESVVFPNQRPDLFTGLRSPPRGVLLYGPPGNGKTLIAKAIATEAKSVFFSISASSLTSKYLGDSEKLVRCLFTLARAMQPSIVFIDEIDSILSARNSNEHEASRRLKTEFLVQFDGITSKSDDRVVLIAATNRPEEIDEAARRRFVKRIYIPMPDYSTRLSLLTHLLQSQKHSLTAKQLGQIAELTEGYSASDLRAVCQDAALEALRELGRKLLDTPSEAIRPLSEKDLKTALTRVRPSVSPQSLQHYEKWTKEYGSFV